MPELAAALERFGAMSAPLLGWVGDDLTGSVDCMEALDLAGVAAALFLAPPTDGDLAAVAHARALGIATQNREEDPETIRATVAPAVERLARLGAPLIHYKVCSTFDSAPGVGSIGAAIDAAQEVLEAEWVPLLVAAPRLGRHQAFGNLFARSGWDEPPARLDRHPTMRTHPVTPMDEADLRLHLARQTARTIALLDVLAVESAEPAEALAAARAQGEIVLLDCVVERHLPVLGALIAPARLVVGSAGVEHALTAHWRAAGVIPAAPAPRPAPPAERVLAVAGSCSPVSRRQIAAAEQAGVPTIRLRLDGDGVEEAAGAAIAALAAGRSALVHTQPADGEPQARLPGPRIGAALGDVAGRVLSETGADRLVVAGGDTSGQVLRRLGVRVLEPAYAFQPTTPLCRAHTADGDLGAQVIFKGGQMGSADFFLAAQRGSASDERTRG